MSWHVQKSIIYTLQLTCWGWNGMLSFPYLYEEQHRNISGPHPILNKADSVQVKHTRMAISMETELKKRFLLLLHKIISKCVSMITLRKKYVLSEQWVHSQYMVTA